MVGGEQQAGESLIGFSISFLFDSHGFDLI